MDDSDIAVGQIIRMLEAAPPDQRERVAMWLGGAIADTTFVGEEGLVLARLAESLCHDPEIAVRKILAELAARNEHLPPAITRQLAQDVDSVAVPFIRKSEALTDQDLVHVIKRNNTLLQLSVARRDQVSKPVSHALIDTGKMPVVKGLVANNGAEIHESDFDLVLSAFGGVSSVTRLLAKRMDLPDSVSRRIGRSRRIQREAGNARRRIQVVATTPHWLSKS